MLKRLSNLIRKATVDRPAVGQTPCDVIHTENKWKLLRYRNDNVQHEQPILLVPSLINRHYVLDLKPGKSFVEWLVAKGWDVFIVDWGTPTKEDRFLEFDEFCDRYLDRAVKRTAKFAGTEKVHMLGYCLGGTLTSIYGAIHPERVASMVNLAAPIDFEDNGLLAEWSQLETFELKAVVDAFGNMPWPLMQLGFHLLRPTLNLQKAIYALDRAWDDQFLDGFIALETWGNDNVSFPGKAFVKYIQELYRENRLIKGELAISGRIVDLAKIDFPTLVVSFEHDNIVSAKSAQALLPFIGDHGESIHLRGGHVGAVVSSKACDRLWPQIENWFISHDGEAPPLRATA